MPDYEVLPGGAQYFVYANSTVKAKAGKLPEGRVVSGYTISGYVITQEDLSNDYDPPFAVDIYGLDLVVSNPTPSVSVVVTKVEGTVDSGQGPEPFTWQP